LHFLRSGRPGLGPSNLFADATPIVNRIDAPSRIDIYRQRGAMIDAGGDFRTSDDMRVSVAKIVTFNPRGLGTSWYVRRRSGICAQKRIMGTIFTVTAFTFAAPAKLAPSG
jgi:hypothetical protein